MKHKWKLIKKTKKYKGLDTYHPIIHKLLANLGLNQKEAQEFLQTQIQNLPEHTKLFDIDKACEEILKYQTSNEKVYIHGDFDTDGIVATSILWDFLYRKLKIDCIPIIPNRFDDGYGLSKNTLDKISKSGATLVITVDCGIKDIEIIKEYPHLKFIITDHHAFPTDEEGNKIIPSAKNLLAVVHPQHPSGKYPNQEICGANVSWKLISGLNKCTGEKHNVKEYLDLVALATITDIMPLRGENRIIVKHGVEIMKLSKNTGLNALLSIVNVDKGSLQTYHLGYIIGPHFNAAGRIESALDAVRLLSTQDQKTALQLSKKIGSLNQQRQTLTEELILKADKQVDASKKLICAYGEEWPEGIIGLIAGKLCEKYYRPTLVMSIDRTKKLIKGSARSISKYNITEALSKLSEYLERYGGHKQAAGFTVKYERFEEFISAVENLIEDTLPAEDLIPEIEIIDKIEPETINHELITTIEALEPYGNGNPKPKFLLEDLEVIENKILGNGDKHYRLNTVKNGTHLTAIGFNKKHLMQDLKMGDIISIVGCPNINRWNGREYIQFEIIDLKINE